MKWIETYHLLASSQIIRRLQQSLPEIGAHQLINEAGFQEARILINGKYDNELVVSFEWDTLASPEGSRPGLLLQDYLIQFGLVKQSLWQVTDILNANSPNPKTS